MRFEHFASIPRPLTALPLVTIILACPPLDAQQQFEIAHDPAPNAQAPTRKRETVIESHGSRLLGMLLLASGRPPHRTVILLQGFPGYEQNMDLAQALRRGGWNVLAMHHRGKRGADQRGRLVLHSACREDRPAAGPRYLC